MSVQMWLGIGRYSSQKFNRVPREWLFFITYLSLNTFSLRRVYQEEDLEPVEPNLPPGEKLHVPVFHDESICRSNELRRRVWVQNGKMPLRKKGEGRSIHISEFIVEETGRIAVNEEQCQINSGLPPAQRLVTTDAREIIYPGKNSDGWWNMERLILRVYLGVILIVF